ncbi:hypothetical protein FACS189449_00190 [Alphaproteobacteria bacterium]|nr:hypothetical protein FACS189449_00190 [Alphaproteobacteria bacterium]
MLEDEPAPSAGLADAALEDAELAESFAGTPPNAAALVGIGVIDEV